MKVIMARPLVRGLANMSAYRPPITVRGTEAQVPQMARKTRSDGQLGARALASVEAMNRLKVQSATGFRPTLSLSGLKTSGPKMYPTRYTAVGRKACESPSTPKSSIMKETALLVMAEEMVLLTVNTTAVRLMNSFLP